MAEASKEEIINGLQELRNAMLAELGSEYIAGMERAFDICFETLNGVSTKPEIANSQFGPGISIAADTIKNLKVEAVKPYLEANRKALNTVTNTATETHTGETPNG
jgi:3-oxoacyl-ACP reductase-like protein